MSIKRFKDETNLVAKYKLKAGKEEEMKAKVETTNSEFKGFTVTFKIQTEEEAIRFHDKVAIKICQGPHDFIGDIHNRRLGKVVEDKEYTI